MPNLFYIKFRKKFLVHLKSNVCVFLFQNQSTKCLLIETQQTKSGIAACGYGASAEDKGKYKGFGSTSFYKQETIVDQVIIIIYFN